MRVVRWLGAAALVSTLAVGCPGDDDDGSEPDASSDSGSHQGMDDAGSGTGNDGGGAGNGGSSTGNDGGTSIGDASVIASDGGIDASLVDAGASQDASAGNDGGNAGGAGGSGAAGSGYVPPDRSCNWQSVGGQLAEALRRVNQVTCRLCSPDEKDRSNCSEAAFSETLILCIRDAVCGNETLEEGAGHMTNCLDRRNGECNQDAELSCTNGCLYHAAGDAHFWCGEDPTFGAALAKCGFDLTRANP
jgi:hypothetical protein